MMAAQSVPVGEGTRVFLNFSVCLEDGSEVDSNFGADPVEFVVGDGNLLPGFERCLLGMSAGQRQIFSVPPEDAFGKPRDENRPGVFLCRRRGRRAAGHDHRL